MSAPIWYLEYEGQKRPLKEWGITKAVLKLVSLAADTLTLECGPADITSDPIFVFNHKVILYQGATIRFVGRVKRQPVLGTAQADRQSYVIAGPWWDLERVIFEQNRRVPIDPTDPESKLTTITTSDVMLFQQIIAGEVLRVTAANQLISAVSVARNRTANVTWAGLSIEGAITPPFEGGIDMTCAEVVRRCARWSPDSISWLDYTAAIPVLYVKRRAHLNVVTLDLAEGNLVIEVRDVMACKESQPTGLKLYIQVIKKLRDGTYSQSYRTYYAGYTAEKLGLLVNTIQVNPDDVDATTDLANLAADFWDTIKDLNYSGSVTVYDETGTVFLGPGSTLNLQGGQTAWATMGALIQSLDFDLITNLQTATFGPPEHLGVQDFLALVQNHTRARPTPGKDGKDGKNGRDGGRYLGQNVEIPTFEKVTACVNGTDKEINVRTN